MQLSHGLSDLSGLKKRDPDQVFTRDTGAGALFWTTGSGELARWSIGVAIILAFVAYFIIGHWHGKRRIAKGLRPLWYHRWLMNKHMRLTMRLDANNRVIDPMYNTYRQDDEYSYALHPLPPPVYDPSAPAPPSYQPPLPKPEPSPRVSELTVTSEDPATRDVEAANGSRHPADTAVYVNEDWLNEHEQQSIPTLSWN